MYTKFKARQSVEIAVPEQKVPIQHYLSQPRRLVNALVDPTRMEQLSEDCFRLKIRPLDFMMFKIQPTVDMKVWVQGDGDIHLKSVGCDLGGIELLTRRFHLDLRGGLFPHQRNGETYLNGKANLEVQVELPPPLGLTPKSLLETTGNGLLKNVLLTIKQRLMQQLLLDYRQWAMNQTSS